MLSCAMGECQEPQWLVQMICIHSNFEKYTNLLLIIMCHFTWSIAACNSPEVGMQSAVKILVSHTGVLGLTPTSSLEVWRVFSLDSHLALGHAWQLESFGK